MIDPKKLLIGVAVVAGSYLLFSGKEALPGGGKPLPTTGILPGQGGNGLGSFILPGDTFTGFAPIERSKIVLPESPFIPYPTVTPPYVPDRPVDDGDDGKPAVVTEPGKGILEQFINIKEPWVSKKTIEEGLGSTIVEESPILSFFGWIGSKMKEAKIKSGVREGIPGAGHLADVERVGVVDTKKESLTHGISPTNIMGIGMGVVGMKAAATKHYTKKETSMREHPLVTQAKASQAYRSGRVTFGKGITGGGA